MMRSRGLAVPAGLALALLCACPAGLYCESVSLTTYYPSPAGVYKKLKAGTYKFIPFQTRAEMDVAPMPDPGTIVYCRETDGYYVSLASADAAAPGTWWARIVLDNTPENILAQGSMDFQQPNNSYAWAKPMGVTTGKLYYNNQFIRSVVKTTVAGFYTGAASGRVCEVLPSSPAPAAFQGPNAATVFRLRLRVNGSYIAEQLAFTLGEAADQENDCGFDPSDTSVVPASENAKCYCAAFSLSGQLNLPVRNQPYIGLLSYGTKSTIVPQWNAGKHYGGYIVHVDDMRLYK